MGKLTPKQLAEKPGKLKGLRGTWETHWRSIAVYFLPLRREINEEPAKGNKRNLQLLDNTGIQALELLSAGLQSMLTNPNLMWFDLTTGDEKLDDQDGIRQWLQAETLNVHNVLNNSNFNTEVHQMYMDLGAFGTAAMLIEEDDESVIRFSTKHIKDIYVEENNLGYIDRVYREFKWTAQNLVAEFGEEVMPRSVMECYKKNDTKEFYVVHGVYPKDSSDGPSDEFLPFISQYVLKEEKVVLREGGFREFPYVIPRWTKASNEVYGRSPAMNALPDMKTLNKMTETMMIAAQKVADPPLQVPDDGVVHPVITRPGGLTHVRPGSEPIRPLFNQIPVDFGFQAIEDRRQRVRQSFFVDQLQLQQGPQMTATEVLQRTEEKNRLLGPVLGRMQSEFLRPLIDRVFSIMLKQGMISDPPGELEGRDLDVKYSSMIARAQRVSESQNILRTFEASAPFIELDPDVRDMFNGDEIVRVLARSLNFPQRGLRNDEEIAEIRGARAEAQQQMQQQEMANQQADRISKVGPAVAAAGQAG